MESQILRMYEEETVKSFTSTSPGTIFSSARRTVSSAIVTSPNFRQAVRGTVHDLNLQIYNYMATEQECLCTLI